MNNLCCVRHLNVFILQDPCHAIRALSEDENADYRTRFRPTTRRASMFTTLALRGKFAFSGWSHRSHWWLIYAKQFQKEDIITRFLPVYLLLMYPGEGNPPSIYKALETMGALHHQDQPLPGI